MVSFIRRAAIGTAVMLTAWAGILGDAQAADAVEVPAEERFGEPVADQEPVRNWTLIIGAGGSFEPEYEGSDKFEATPLPFILFTYGDWLEINPGGAELQVVEYKDLSFSALVGYELGRDEDDDDILDGLGDVDFGVTLGGQVAYEFGPLELYASVEKTVSGSEGLIGKAGVSYQVPVTERLILGANAEATLADDKHMEAYFGIDAIQAAASGLPQYEAEAGLKRVDVSASATYFVTKNWLVRGEAGVGFLTGDAADSPIVKDDIQPSATLAVGYKF